MNPIGKRRQEAILVGFEHSVKVEFQGSHVTSGPGLPAFGELDEAFGLTGMAAKFLTDIRTEWNTRHGLGAQLRQSEYSRCRYDAPRAGAK